MVYGQAGYIRKINYHEDSYWNTFDKGVYSNDPPDGGSLNYHDHVIMVVGNPATGTGFGRIMPLYKEGVRGGMRILKFLWDRGFETFPAVGKAQTYRPPYTGYVYLFQNGLEGAIEMGKAIVQSRTSKATQSSAFSFGG
jgi:hypothetical protein